VNTIFDAIDNPELEKRDEVLDQHEVNYGELLTALRKVLVTIYRFRAECDGSANAFVCADDARAVLDRMPGMDGVNRNFLGQLFRAPGWRATGQRVKSKTEGSHGNDLMAWRYEGE